MKKIKILLTRNGMDELHENMNLDRNFMT